MLVSITPAPHGHRSTVKQPILTPTNMVHHTRITQCAHLELHLQPVLREVLGGGRHDAGVGHQQVQRQPPPVEVGAEAAHAAHAGDSLFVCATVRGLHT